MPKPHKEDCLRSVDKAAQILHGALPEFLHHGYARTSMDRIASAAGVSKQTLYSYFSDKNGLFTALVEQMAAQKFRLVWSQPLQGEPEVALRTLAQRLLQEVNDEEYLCFVRLIVAESKTRPDLAQLFLSNVAQPAIAALTRYLEQRREQSTVADCRPGSADTEATARIFVGSLIHFLFTQEILSGKAIMPFSQERLIDTLIELVVPQRQRSSLN
ncbi:MAG: TetR/AcrR family transcriptional regulator [Cyanophyceae cyanobacterium]